MTLDQVRQAIMFAGNQGGWQMRQDVPGKIIATHQRSGQMAVIDISYNTQTFSIVYFDSANLQYRANPGTVQPTYNLRTSCSHVTSPRRRVVGTPCAWPLVDQTRG